MFAEPDASLRNCMARISRREVTTAAQISRLITDSFEVGDDCRSKLEATWKSIDDTRLSVETFNKAQEGGSP